MANENIKGFDVSIAPLPLNFSGGPQSLAQAIADRLIIRLNQNTSFVVVGTEEPTSDQGPWLNTNFDPAQWYVFSPSEGKYVPAGIPQERLKYIVSSLEPDETIYDMWMELGPLGRPRDLNHFDGNRWVGLQEDLMIRKIVMFSGDLGKIQLPWALCNGQVVHDITTPDLTSRFIVGAGVSAGAGPDKYLSANLVGGADTIGNHTHSNPDVDDTALIPAQIPPLPFISDNTAVVQGAPDINESRGGGTRSHIYSQIVGTVNPGGGAGHGHSQGNTGGAGGHDNRPEYYSLAFIMYVGYDFVEEYDDLNF